MGAYLGIGAGYGWYVPTPAELEKLRAPIQAEAAGPTLQIGPSRQSNHPAHPSFHPLAHERVRIAVAFDFRVAPLLTLPLLLLCFHFFLVIDPRVALSSGISHQDVVQSLDTPYRCQIGFQETHLVRILAPSSFARPEPLHNRLVMLTYLPASLPAVVPSQLSRWSRAYASASGASSFLRPNHPLQRLRDHRSEATTQLTAGYSQRRRTLSLLAAVLLATSPLSRPVRRA